MDEITLWVGRIVVFGAGGGVAVVAAVAAWMWAFEKVLILLKIKRTFLLWAFENAKKRGWRTPAG